MKIKQEQVNKIRELYKNGEPIIVIANKLKLPVFTCRYWIDEQTTNRKRKLAREYFAKLPKEKKKEIYKNKVDYYRRYMSHRYKTDPDFRKLHIERVKESRKRRVKNGKAITKE